MKQSELITLGDEDCDTDIDRLEYLTNVIGYSVGDSKTLILQKEGR
jgi:hypothetical protein